MGRKRKVMESPYEVPDTYKAIDAEARQQQMINYAINLAEQKLRDGTASSQLLCHYIGLASTKAQLELEVLRNKAALLQAQTEAVADSKEIKALYADAIRAMRSYQGDPQDNEDV